MILTNLVNFIRMQEGKSFSRCLRIAADMIETIDEESPNLINQYPEKGYEVDAIFRKLCQHVSGINLVEQSKYSVRPTRGKTMRRK